ncbi:MAG: ATP synthase F1 subunit delta [Clostridia bacterium]|nr:ATP synthase F1 subunit delta [Clostridia bacterium]
MTQTAKNYGGALYDLAKEDGLEAEILKELQVIDGCFGAEADYVKLLATASVPKQERRDILERDFGGKIQPYVLNFLMLLTERGYIREFHGCAEVFRHRYNEDAGILEAVAVTAIPLPSDLREKLLKKLSGTTGKKIDLCERIDPSVLGGIRLEMDGQQLDGTVRHRLDDIRKILGDTVL